MSAGDINHLMQLWDAIQHQKLAETFGDDYPGLEDANAPYAHSRDLLSTIDSVPFGDVPWQGFKVRYRGELPASPPSWMTAEYEVWFRNPLEVLESQLGNPEFAEHMDWAAKKIYSENGKRQFVDLMSADWAWEQSVSLVMLRTVCTLTTRAHRTSLQRWTQASMERRLRR